MRLHRLVVICCIVCVSSIQAVESNKPSLSSKYAVRNFVDHAIVVKDYAGTEEMSEYASVRLSEAREQLIKYYKEHSSVRALQGSRDRKVFLETMAHMCNLESSLQIQGKRLQKILSENKLENLGKLFEFGEIVIFDISKLKEAMRAGEQFSALSYNKATNELLYEWDFPEKMDRETQVTIPLYIMLRLEAGDVKKQVDEQIDGLINSLQDKAIEVCAYQTFRCNAAYIGSSILEEHSQVPKWFAIGVSNYLALNATMNIYGPDKARIAFKMHYVGGGEPFQDTNSPEIAKNFDENSANSVRWAIHKCEQLASGPLGDETIPKLLGCAAKSEKEYILKIREQFHIDMEKL